MEQGIFNKSAEDRIRSPEQLNDYIKVSNPAVWMALLAIFALLAGLIAWAALGELSDVLPASAVREGEGLTFYLPAEDAGQVTPGMLVRLEGGGEATVRSVADTVVSQSAAAEAVGDEYTAYAMNLPEWGVRVTCEYAGQWPSQAVIPVSVVVGQTRPLAFLWNGEGE